MSSSSQSPTTTAAKSACSSSISASRGECELAFIGLVPELAGKGHGRWLLAEAISRAWRDGVKRVHVHTCSLDHPAALAAYRRAGFTPYRRAVERFPDPRLLGILPRDCAPQVPLLGRRLSFAPRRRAAHRSAPASPRTRRDGRVRDRLTNATSKRARRHRLDGAEKQPATSSGAALTASSRTIAPTKNSSDEAEQMPPMPDVSVQLRRMMASGPDGFRARHRRRISIRTPR